MTMYMIYEGEVTIGLNKKKEWIVNCAIKEEEAKNYLRNWGSNFEKEIDILEWNRFNIPLESGYGQIYYETMNQDHWCRYEPIAINTGGTT